MIRQATMLITDEKGTQHTQKLTFERDTERENELLTLYPQMHYQTFMGLGGALTEAAGTNYMLADETIRQDILRRLFHPTEGLGYTIVRLPIHSCDFSKSSYTYIDDNDVELKSFSIARDRQSILPFAVDAQKYVKNHGRQLCFYASPWSPPAFMKTNKDMRFGGKLLSQYNQAWADYYVAYLHAYQQEGIDICAVTVQNEAKASQSWESCQYTAEEESKFAVRYLRKALDQNGFSSVKILLWDHNKERLYDRMQDSLAVKGAKQAIGGFAFHWYSGDHFQALDMVHEAYPEHPLFLSEFCCGASRGNIAGKRPTWSAVALYAHELIGDFAHHVVGATDWNMLLDDQGGPYHDRERGCTSVLTYCPVERKLRVEAQYNAMAHFSRYIQTGATRIASSSWNSNLQQVAFQNLDGYITVVMLNETEHELPVCLRINDDIACCSLKPRTLATMVIQPIS